MKDSFFFGPDAIGRHTVCPRDGEFGCAYVDTLSADDRRPANCFLSWVWSYKLSIFQSSILTWLSRLQDEGPRDVYFFVCFFCNNQYRILVEESQRGSDNLDMVFETRLKGCGRVLALLDDWKTPVYCTRIWTIYEQFMAAELEIHVEVILPPAAEESLLTTLMSGARGIEEVTVELSRSVRSKDAVASVVEDEQKVKQLIANSVGFDTVDQKVIERLVKWVAEQFHRSLGYGVQAKRRQHANDIHSRRTRSDVNRKASMPIITTQCRMQ
jgi:hypothetical protein